MSAEPARRLHLVDGNTGEVVESRELADLQALAEKLAGDLKAAEKDLRAKRRIITDLQRDKARERLEHPRYADAVRVAKYWWRRCRAQNPRVNYRTPDRLDAVLALMDIEEIVVDEDTRRRRREPHYTLGDFKAAVDGAWFDAYEAPRKNGSMVKYDDLALICRSSAKFDEFILKSPKPPVAVDTDRDASNLSGEGSKPAPTSGALRSEVKHGPVGRIMGATGRCLATPQQGGGLHVQWRVATRLAGEPGA